MRLLALAMLTFAWLAGVAYAQRSKAAGIVSYREFSQKKSDAYFRNSTEPLFALVAGLGLDPEWVSIDVFLPVNEPARDQYQRIIIPNTAHWFTEEMYEGMGDYVRAGGLLITTVPLCGLDVNRNYARDDADKWLPRPGSAVSGVHGHSGVVISRVRVEMACPLTEGIAAGEWLDLERPLNVRMIRNGSAAVLMRSDAAYKGNPHREQPFLTFKHAGRGACVYLPAGVRLDEKHVATVTRNALSRDVLEWLTAGE